MNTKQQARHLDATLSEDCEDYETESYEVDLIPEKYAQSVGGKFFSLLKTGTDQGHF